MAKQLVDIFKALGEETRLEIVSYLLHNEQCACDFCECITKDQTTISRHLKLLEQSNLVLKRKKGRNVIYSLNPKFREKLIAFGVTQKPTCCVGTCSCEVKK